MPPRDPAWPLFVDELRQHLTRRGVTSAALARALDVDEETVRNWRKGKTRPLLAQLPKIAEVLGMGAGSPGGQGDPLYLLRRMQLLPAGPGDRELIDAAYRLQKLELKLTQAMDRAGSHGRREGAGVVVRAAMQTSRWAVAVWPAVEGPPSCRLHVADRIDIRRTDNEPTTNQEVWHDQALKGALRAAYAVPATRGPRWSTDEGTSHWSISHVGSPRSPLVSLPYSGLSSLCCFALTVDSWVNDVGSLIATALGYGLTTTRDLAMEAYGLHSGATLADHRRAAHETRLERPPERRVWTHHAPLGQPQSDPLQAGSGVWRNDVCFVWLRESDELLQRFVDRKQLPGLTLKALQEDRDRVDALITQLPNPPQVIIVDVDRRPPVDDRWKQVLEGVSSALTQLVDRGFLDPAAVEMIHPTVVRDDPKIALPLLNWLYQDGCPVVAAERSAEDR